MNRYEEPAPASREELESAVATGDPTAISRTMGGAIEAEEGAPDRSPNLIGAGGGIGAARPTEHVEALAPRDSHDLCAQT